MNWLTQRTPRERGLILIAGAILALFLAWQFIVSPVIDMKARAISSHAAAERNLDIVQQKAGLLNRSPTQTSLARFNRSVLITEARAVNLPISRVQPQSDGSLQVWFENTGSPELFFLLDSLKTKYAVDITRLQISRRSDLTVTAQVTLVPLGA